MSVLFLSLYFYTQWFIPFVFSFPFLFLGGGASFWNLFSFFLPTYIPNTSSSKRIVRKRITLNSHPTAEMRIDPPSVCLVTLQISPMFCLNSWSTVQDVDCTDTIPLPFFFSSKILSAAFVFPSDMGRFYVQYIAVCFLKPIMKNFVSWHESWLCYGESVSEKNLQLEVIGPGWYLLPHRLLRCFRSQQDCQAVGWVSCVKSTVYVKYQ